MWRRLFVLLVELFRMVLRRRTVAPLPLPEPPSVPRGTQLENKSDKAVAREPSPPPIPPQPKRVPMAFSSSVEFWRAALADQADGVPIDFLLAWLQHESGGNPCSTGFAGQGFPDGFFKFEAGIGQQFFQSRSREALNSVSVHGVTLATLRAPCSGQRATRALTEDEKAANVQAFIGDVQKMRTKAATQVAAAGLSWDESTEDFWMLVKLQHGLPCLPAAFLRPAAEAGKADTFADFASFVNGLSRADYTKFTAAVGCGASMAGRFGGNTAVLNNAIKTGKGAGASLLDDVGGVDLSDVGVILPAVALVVFARFVM